MECAWISNFVTLETEALLTFCQEEYGVGSERARAGAGLKAGFLRQKNIRTKEVCASKKISVLMFFCLVFIFLTICQPAFREIQLFVSRGGGIRKYANLVHCVGSNV